MSIVGTRPPLIGEVSEYELHHRARLAIKPGITGMWQVSGRSDITDFEEVVELDKNRICLIKDIMFVSDEHGSILFHKPHPQKELKAYQIKQLIEILEQGVSYE